MRGLHDAVPLFPREVFTFHFPDFATRNLCKLPKWQQFYLSPLVSRKRGKSLRTNFTTFSSQATAKEPLARLLNLVKSGLISHTSAFEAHQHESSNDDVK